MTLCTRSLKIHVLYLPGVKNAHIVSLVLVCICLQYTHRTMDSEKVSKVAVERDARTVCVQNEHHAKVDVERTWEQLHHRRQQCINRSSRMHIDILGNDPLSIVFCHRCTVSSIRIVGQHIGCFV